MKEIELTQGQVAIVDDEDYEYLSQWKWQASKNYKEKFYARRNDGNKKVYMHRQIIKVKKDEEIDHINGDTLDNRKENLRACCRRDNSRNAISGRKNKHGFKGVRLERKKFSAKIFDGKKHISISGNYKTSIEAARAYDKKAIELFGEFALLNFPEDVQ
jgi:hypothetical protein